jgi:SulP family sulfate permease
MLALTEATSIARAIALRTGQRIDGNQAFVGQGLANVAGRFFYHVDRAFRTIDARNPEQVHLMVAATGINIVDVAGVELLAREAERRRALGGGLYLHRVKDEVRVVLDRGGYTARIGPDALYPMKGDIMGSVYARLDPAICRACTVRIFRPCRVRLPDGTLRPPDAPPPERALPS